MATTNTDTTTTTPLKDVITASHSSENVRVIKDYAVWLLSVATGLPTSTTWTPPSGTSPIGWNTEDGAELEFKSGDNTDIKGHDGSVVLSLSAPGNYTLKIPAMETTKAVAQAYFGVTVGSDGSIHSAGNPSGMYQLVLAGIDQNDKPVIIVLRDATITDRDSITLSAGKAMTMTMTFTGHTASDGKQLDIYGLVLD